MEGHGLVVGKTTWLAGLALGLIAAATDAYGQVRDSTPVELEPIVVTIAGTPSLILALPYAVSVGGDSSVTRAQPRLALGEIMTALPGVEVQNRYNYALGDRLSIRGFGARTQFGIRGVRVLVDGVPATMADGQTTLDHLDLGTVSRVETWRGPSSALYGNASGGVVRYRTGYPVTGPFRQGFSAEGGTNGLRRLESRTAGRMGRVTGELDVSLFSYDGYRAHSAADKIFATARLGYETGRDRFRLVVTAVDLEAQNPGSLSDSALAADPAAANPFNVVQQTGKDARQLQLGLTWTRQTGAGSLEVTAWGLGRKLTNPIPVAVIDLDRTAAGARGQWDHAFRVGERQGRFLLGVEAAYQDDDRKNFANQQGVAGQLRLDQRERVGNLAPFVQLHLPLSSRLLLLGGVRYDWIRFQLDDHFTTGDPDDSGSRTLSAWSPTLGVFFDLDPAVALYGNYSTAFETPTTTELINRPDGSGGLNPDLEPQEAESFEVGIKGRVAGSVEYQVALYQANVTNELIPFEVPSDPGRTFFANAGSARHRGLEVGLDWRAARGLVVRGQYTYTDARFTEFAFRGESFDGNRIPGVAPNRAEILVAYDAPGGWYLSASGRYVDAIPVDNANDATAAAYLIGDIRLGWHRVPIGSTALSPFIGVSNVLDHAYVSAVTPNAFGGRYFEPGPGRALWLGLGWRFSRGGG